MRHIFLYGPPGSGKSTIGKILAANLQLPFLDLDWEIEKESGQTIAQIMAKQGETAFRDLESMKLKKAIFGPVSVIALGGGALLRDINREQAEYAGNVVFLDADVRTLIQRIMPESRQRPLLADSLEQRLPELLTQRASHYNTFKLRITTVGSQPDTIAHSIQLLLGFFHVGNPEHGYDIIIQKGALDDCHEFAKRIASEGEIIIVADENVSRIYGEKLQYTMSKVGKACRVLIIPAGEKAKTIGTISYLWHGFLENGLDRRSAVIAFGGGVTGDLTGFAASTYMRGIKWICLPTTLLAMVDSSLGGKTGFDLPEGKNLIGAFHSPIFVLSDPNILETLPENEFVSGLAEVVKHGVIADPVLFQLCSRGDKMVRANLSELIGRAVAVKVRIIGVDPHEQGERASLNYGHTVGHALEKVSGFTLRHGEAVSIGLVIEARLAERLGLARMGLSEDISATLNGLGLPVKVPSCFPIEEILNAMQYDKKKDRGKLLFALPAEIGDVRYGIEVKNVDGIIWKE
jgi:shikimate kinase / 3-dehydroquinate synthase